MEEQVKQTENPGEQNDKVSKKYDSNIKKLVALFNGEEAFKKEKVGNTELAGIIAELTKEKKEGLIKSFKEKATKLLTSKVEFDKFVSAKEAEFKQAIVNKKKEFNTEMEECFKLIENIDTLQKEYQTSFESLGKPEEKKD